MKAERSSKTRGVVLVLSGIVAGSILSGPAVAHVGNRVGHLVNRHLVNFFYTEAEADGRFINSNEKASDSNLLDGVDSSGFLSASGKAADANLLDGINSTGFLLAGGKAVDADKLDNIDSASFLQGTTSLAGSRSCPGSGFYPEGAATTYDTVTADGERFNNSGGADVFRCAVDLPSGAVISSATFALNDPAAGGVISDCQVTRTDLTVAIGSEGAVTTAPAATADAGAVSVSGAAIAGTATVSNTGFGYSFECTLGDDTGIYGAFLSYTVPASAG